MSAKCFGPICEPCNLSVSLWMLSSFVGAWRHVFTQETPETWKSQTSRVLFNLWEDSKLHPGRGWYPRMVLVSACTSSLGEQTTGLACQGSIWIPKGTGHEWKAYVSSRSQTPQEKLSGKSQWGPEKREERQQLASRQTEMHWDVMTWRDGLASDVRTEEGAAPGVHMLGPPRADGHTRLPLHFPSIRRLGARSRLNKFPMGKKPVLMPLRALARWFLPLVVPRALRELWFLLSQWRDFLAKRKKNSRVMAAHLFLNVSLSIHRYSLQECRQTHTHINTHIQLHTCAQTHKYTYMHTHKHTLTNINAHIHTYT